MTAGDALNDLFKPTMPVITGDMGQMDAALTLGAADIYVFPVDHPGLDLCAGIGQHHNPQHPDDRGKHPAVKWESGASTSVHNITYWWSGNPRNIGIHCGRSGLLVVDEDEPGAFERYAADHGFTIPETYRVKTAHGQHYYFADTEGGALGNREGGFGNYPINIRSGAGYVVGPSSIHETGITYSPINDAAPVPVPQWIVDAIKAKPEANGHKVTDANGVTWENVDPFAPVGYQLPDVIKDHHRDTELFKFACSMRAQSINRELAKVLMEVAWKRCEQPPQASHEFTWDDALAKLDNAYDNYQDGRSEGYQRQHDQPHDNTSAVDDRKVADAAGQVRVAEVKLEEVRKNEGATESQRLAAEERLAAAQRRLAAAERDAAASEQESQRRRAAAARKAATASGKDGRTDDGNALRLVEAHGDVIRRISDMKRWHYWDGQRWALDNEGKHVRELQRELARQLPSEEDEEKQFKHISLNSVGLSGAIRVAESDPRVAIDAMELDAYPELLNTPSGIVDLRTGQLLPHDPNYLLTRITMYGADLAGPHPRWGAFLAETFGKDDELISYMQRLAGVALLGNVVEHILPFLHGIGANGKGVFTLVLQGLLGNADVGGYAVTAPDGFLMTGREGKHETEMARLRGARLVVCSEQTSGKRFDEAKVKKLTGGDKLTGRFMRGDFFDFMPSHLVWVLSNHLPEVREGGPSFWRRVRKIPFLHVVPEDQRIGDLHDQLLAGEGAAILGWMVRGAVEVLANGLNDPASVIKATREYEISEDSLASFVSEECRIGPYFYCTVADFRQRYQRHCEEMGAEALTAKALTMRLTTEYQVTAGKGSKGVRVYRGIEFQSNPEDDDS